MACWPAVTLSLLDRDVDDVPLSCYVQRLFGFVFLSDLQFGGRYGIA